MGVDYSPHVGVLLSAREGAQFGLRAITLEERGELSANIANPVYLEGYTGESPMDEEATHVLQLGGEPYAVQRLCKTDDPDAAAFWLPFFGKRTYQSGRLQGMVLPPDRLVAFAARVSPLVEAGAVLIADVWADC